MSSLIAIYSDMIQNEMDIEKEVLKGTEAKVKFFSSEDMIYKELSNIEVLILANPEINREKIEKMDKCKAIIRRGIGIDNIDIKAAFEKDIVVCNVPDYCYTEVSNLTIALIMALIRRIPMYYNDVKKGIWHIDSPKGLPLAGRMENMTLGLVGLGNIARAVATKAKPFFGEIIAYDPFVSQETAKNRDVKLVEIDQLFNKSDVISLHIPCNSETYHLVNKKLLGLVKSSAYLVNTSRGQLINENDLYDLLSTGRLAGAALDVTEIEPLNSNSPLLKLDNVIVTPHIGFYSLDSFVELRKKAIEEAKRVILGEKVIHQVKIISTDT